MIRPLHTTYSLVDLKENPTCKLIADDGCRNIKELKNRTEPGTIRLAQLSGDLVRMFNQELILPLKTIVFESVIPIVLDDIDNIKEHESVLIELSPQNNFTTKVHYEKPSACKHN